MDSSSPPLPSGNTRAFQISSRRLEITFKSQLQTIKTYRKESKLHLLLAFIDGIERDRFTRIKSHGCILSIPKNWWVEQGFLGCRSRKLFFLYLRRSFSRKIWVLVGQTKKKQELSLYYMKIFWNQPELIY